MSTAVCLVSDNRMEAWSAGIVARVVIYFDPEDEEIDGRGWNLIESGSAFARRFAHRDSAIAAAFFADSVGT